MSQKSLKDKLAFCAANNYNVILVGKHGVGKTAMITEVFNKEFGKQNEDWVYFSGSTMDPWVDFIGCPREKKDEETGLIYLDLIKPKLFALDKIKAIFIDEGNRSHKKIKNAMMELTQFKSINGFRFNSLRVVWTAINPKEEEGFKYDVEEFDPAHEDRFHVKFDIPYIPDSEYFCSKYGDDIGIKSVKWWKDLPIEQKNLISPRRLDYLLDYFLLGGDPRDIVDKKINIDKLTFEIKNGSFSEQLKNFFLAGNTDGARRFLSRPNAYDSCRDAIQKNTDYIEFFLPLLGQEEISSMFAKNAQVRNTVFNNLDRNENFVNILISIIESGMLDPKIKSVAENHLKAHLSERQK